MKNILSNLVCTGLSVALWTAALPANASVNVTQHHNNISRDGVFIDPAFTPSAAASLTRDTSFTGTVVGNIYAQPLYVENGPGGQQMVIAVTESNNVYALNAFTGAVIWSRTDIGAPRIATSPCGNVTPLGITGTPVVDLSSRALFFSAMTLVGGTTQRHMIFSLNVDTGATNAGWPVDVTGAIPSFTSNVQFNRAALGIVNGVLYVPYSGHFGDCGSYRGWVIGIPINNPASVTGWATTAIGGGIWGTGGVSSDGTNLFVITGNTFSTGGTWGGGEAIIRLQAGPVFSGPPSNTNYWAPTDWLSLDNTDTDVGGCGAVLIDVPGATPSQLVLALGKDRKAYLVNRNTLGGVTSAVATATVSSSTLRGQAAVTYRTSMGTYFAFRAGTSNSIGAYKINPANPPTMTSAWSASQTGESSPFVTSTDGTNNFIVWAVATGLSPQRINAYNADTGTVIYSGGGVNEGMTGNRKWNTGIAARGRIYLAGDNKVYAFKVPLNPLNVVSTVSRKDHGGVGTFDIPVPGIESRSGGVNGDYTLVFTFSNNIESGNASVTSGAGSVSGSPVISGNTMTVNLTGVSSPQLLTVTLSSVTDQFLQVLPNTPVTMSVLIGDSSNNSVVNASDVAQTKGQIGQTVTGSNFRTDVNANGVINGTDVTVVKAHIGESVAAADGANGRNRVGLTK